MSACTQGAPPPVPVDWAPTLGGAELHLSGRGGLSSEEGREAELVLLRATSRRRRMSVEEEAAAPGEGDRFVPGRRSGASLASSWDFKYSEHRLSRRMRSSDQTD